MRIVCISDMHERHDQVVLPEGDVLVCSGDFTLEGTPLAIERFGQWLGKQTHKRKVVVAGNHDWLFEKNEPAAIKYLGADVDYLNNASADIGGIKFWGAPQTPWFMDWAFNVERGPDIAAYWSKIPDDTDVLITHGPPMGILDQVTPTRDHLGCYDLMERVDTLMPKLHVFGHIHGGYGKRIIGPSTFVNASVVDEAYRVRNSPIVVDI